jgi:hypothetical protein
MPSPVRRRALCTAVSVATLAGTALLAPVSPAHAVVPAHVKPYDFDGDGHPDVVIGTPGATVNGHQRAGEILVIPGITFGKGNAGAKIWTLDSPGVPGQSHATASDFGFVTASGDVNGDGYADLLVSAPNNPKGRLGDVGSVTLFFGSPTGLTAKGAVELNPSWFGVTSAKEGFFGQAVVIADFDGDGFDDVAISAGGVATQYVVTVRGGAHGLQKATRRTLTQDSPGVPGKRHAPKYGGFGYWMTAGDFNKDGREDLAVSDPFDAEETGYSSGAVTVFPGAKNVYGLTTVGARRWSLSTPGIPGSPTRFTTKTAPDEVGVAMAAGDRDGDGYDDLVIGVPGHDVKNQKDAGAVLTLYGSARGLTTARAFFDTAYGVLGRVRAHEGFGSTVAFANVLGLSRPQVWVAAQFGNEVTQLLHIPTSSGVGIRHPVHFTQGLGRIPGVTEAGDNFGSCLEGIDPDGDGVDTLLVTASGEDGFAGAVTAVNAQVTKTETRWSGVLYEPGRAGLPGVHVHDGESGAC